MKAQNLFLIILSFLLISYLRPCIAQETSPTEVIAEDVFMMVEKMPEFEGGKEALMQFLQKNIAYPKEAVHNGITGTVYVSFVVDTKGDVIDEKIVRGVDKHLNEEALRVVRLMSGKWTPGVQKGKNVKVAYTLPIKFALTEPKNKEGDTNKNDSN